jgi:hypothetical protein
MTQHNRPIGTVDNDVNAGSAVGGGMRIYGRVMLFEPLSDAEAFEMGNIASAAIEGCPYPVTLHNIRPGVAEVLANVRDTDGADTWFADSHSVQQIAVSVRGKTVYV